MQPLNRRQPPEAPRRRDPAPSYWDYKMQRLWLTPQFRVLFRFGLPVLVVVLISAVVLVSGAANAAAVAIEAASRSSLVFMNERSIAEFEGRSFEGSPWCTRILKQQFHFLRGKFFHRAGGDSFQGKRPDLIAAEAFYIVAERGEEEADFAFLAVMHVHVEIGGLIACTGMDQRGSFDF